ncbi:hypothetical protein MYX77_07870, partial [Acidobacteriia bacterium AH_259_A11_L15]|nr:hypothetical protein [Acidobacteriia bacterium AH_259_A11_L15]
EFPSGEEIKRICHTIELARTEVNRFRTDLARELLSGIHSDVERIEGTVAWVLYSLALAETFAASDDPAAKGFFEDALGRMNQVPDVPPDLKSHIHEDYGKYLFRLGYRSKARLQFEAAKKVAAEQGRLEDSARMTLRLINIELELDKDPQLTSFKNMKNSALERGETHQAQLAAWHQYWGSIEAKRHAMKFGRDENVASKEYFAALFRSIGK